MKPIRTISSQKTKVWALALLVALITFVIYLPALQNGFVEWDDPQYVSENQNIRYINLIWIFTSVNLALWHPLTMFSFAIDYAVWGLNPLGFHLTNIIFHALNTILVFILTVGLINIKRTVHCNYKTDATPFRPEKTYLAGFVIALLFGIHPLRVESVAWVSGRKDIFCAFFFLTSLLTYLKYIVCQQPKRVIFYSLCFLFFAMALMSKPMAVSLPLILLILDFYPLNRFVIDKPKTILYEKLPFILLSFVLSGITVGTYHAEGAFQALPTLPFLERTLIAIWSYIFYIIKMIWPFKLIPVYSYSLEIDFANFGYSTVLFLIITLFALRSSIRGRLFFAIWCSYVIALIPVMGIVRPWGHAVVDRYTYISSLIPLLLAGIAVNSALDRFSKKQCYAAIVIFIFLSGILAARTIKQVFIWHDSVTLWSHQIKYFPNSLAYYNRGIYFRKMGNYRQAMEDIDKAIKQEPTYLKAYVERGNIYHVLGNYHLSITNFGQAIEINHSYADAYYNRGLTFAKMGDQFHALKDFSKAIELNPRFAEAYYNRGNVHLSSGNYWLAIKDYNDAINLNHRYVKAYNNRGVAYFLMGDYQPSIKDFNKVIKLVPEDMDALYSLGLAYSRWGRHEQAYIYYKKAAAMGSKQAQDYISNNR